MKLLETKYNHKAVEEGKYDYWLKNGFFTSGDTKKIPYTIVIPPPNVTGKLHIGHACDTAFQDIIIRQKRMAGYDALWLPGMDHAGIATQAKVDAKLKDMVSTSTNEEFKKKLKKEMEAMQKGETIAEPKQTSYTYEELLSLSFKLILNSDYYSKQNGLWLDRSDNKEYMKEKPKKKDEPIINKYMLNQINHKLKMLLKKSLM